MWNARNTTIHGADSKSRQKSRICRASVILHHFHTKRDTVLATDRKLFIAATTKDIDQCIQSRTAGTAILFGTQSELHPTRGCALAVLSAVTFGESEVYTITSRVK